MEKIVMRLMFVFAPALAFGSLGSLLVNDWLGLAIFVFFVGLGFDVTKARPERGEQ